MEEQGNAVFVNNWNSSGNYISIEPSKGIGVEKQGHNLGHMPQHENPIWIKIRQYNSQMLVKLILVRV